MSEKRKKPTERQKNCSYSFPYMGENFDQIPPPPHTRNFSRELGGASI